MKKKLLVFLLVIFVFLAFPIGMFGASSGGSTYPDPGGKLEKISANNFGGLNEEFIFETIKTSDGGYLIVGSTKSTQSGDITDINNGVEDALIVKFDKYGTKEWDQVFGGSDSDKFYYVIQTIDGGYLTVGSTKSSQSGDIEDINNGGEDGLMVKFDTNGEKEWDQVFGGEKDDAFSSVIENNDGSLIVVGASEMGSSGEISDVNIKLNGYNTKDGLIVKFNHNGEKISDNLFGGNGFDQLSSVVKTDDGGYIVVGNTTSAASGDLSQGMEGIKDGLIVKFNLNFEKEWDKVFGGSRFDLFNTVIQDNDGNYVVVGSSESTKSQYYASDITDNNNGESDGLIVKFNQSGDVLLNKLLGGNRFDGFSSIINISDQYIVSGYSNSSQNGDITDTNNGLLDGLVVKYNKNFDSEWNNLIGGSGDDNLTNIINIDSNVFITTGFTLSSNSGDISDLNNGGRDGLIVFLTPQKYRPILDGDNYKIINKNNNAYDLIQLFNVKATDVEDGNLNRKILVDDSLVNYSEEGKYPIVFSVTDSDGNSESITVELEVLPDLVTYRTHVQDIGWQDWKHDGEISGTTGRSLRLEGIEINIQNTENLGIAYSTHVENIGWQDWKFDGEMSGTSGQSLRLEAIKIMLTGSEAENYDIYYRVHAQNYGWLGWSKNGLASGTEGLGLRLEGIEIKVVPKGAPAPGTEDNRFVSAYGDGLINYTTHVQNIGWQDWRYDGTVSGTSGMALRLEGIRIRLHADLTDVDQSLAGIRYMTHIQDVGWQDWRNDGQMSGTTGQSLRLEAIKIELTGEIAKYVDVYYRVHVQDYGWMGWAINGQPSGTSGLAKRLEAIQIGLVLKEGVNPATLDFDINQYDIKLNSSLFESEEPAYLTN